MEKDEHKTKVIFREWKRADFKGSIDAVFPELPADYYGRYMTCYTHIGQHGSCDWLFMITITKPAKMSNPAVKALFDELEGRGYNLQVVQKNNFACQDQFRANLQHV